MEWPNIGLPIGDSLRWRYLIRAVRSGWVPTWSTKMDNLPGQWVIRGSPGEKRWNFQGREMATPDFARAADVDHGLWSMCERCDACYSWIISIFNLLFSRYEDRYLVPLGKRARILTLTLMNSIDTLFTIHIVLHIQNNACRRLIPSTSRFPSFRSD